VSAAYDALNDRAKELVDEAALNTVAAFGGRLTVDEARDLVLEHVLQSTSHNGPGTGH